MYQILFFIMALSTINAKIRNIVISGGGAAGFAFYGVLKNSHERGIWNIDNIDKIYATSAGSIIALCISLGYDWKTTDDYIIKRPWNELYKCELPMAIKAIQNQGLFGQQIIRETFLPLFNCWFINHSCPLCQFCHLPMYIAYFFINLIFVIIFYMIEIRYQLLYHNL